MRSCIEKPVFYIEICLNDKILEVKYQKNPFKTAAALQSILQILILEKYWIKSKCPYLSLSFLTLFLKFAFWKSEMFDFLSISKCLCSFSMLRTLAGLHRLKPETTIWKKLNQGRYLSLNEQSEIISTTKVNFAVSHHRIVWCVLSSTMRDIRGSHNGSHKFPSAVANRLIPLKSELVPLLVIE